MNLTTLIGKVTVEGVVGNSPGPRKDLADWLEVGKSPAGVVTSGSFCQSERTGNTGEVFWVDGLPAAALNSLGLPCKNLTESIREVGELLKSCEKPVIVSLAGFSPEDYGLLAGVFLHKDLTIELNLTCPNVAGHGIFAFDLEATRRTISMVRGLIGYHNLVVKLNPHPDAAYIESMCTILEEEQVDAVALCNTVPNCLVLNPDTLKPVITPNKGLAGLSGRGIKPIVMGQVFQYRQRLPEIGIIAEGGVWNGQDIVDYFVAGADFCRTATLYAQKGAKVFADLTTEFIEEMDKRGFDSLADIPRLQPS